MRPVKNAAEMLLALMIMLPGAAFAENAAQAQVPAVAAAMSKGANGTDIATSLGTAIDSGKLDQYRGGDIALNNLNMNNVNGTLTNNVATNVVTGANSITAGSFSNASGIPTVVQNSGANVLIQTSTILNVQFVQ